MTIDFNSILDTDKATGLEYPVFEIDIDDKLRFPVRVQVEGRWWYATGLRGDTTGYRDQDVRVAEYEDDTGNILWADTDGMPLRDWRRTDEGGES